MPVKVLLKCASILCLSLGIVCMANSVSFGDNALIAELKQELESGRMDEWRGSKPLNSMNDIKHYLSTFWQWQDKIDKGESYKGLFKDEKAILRAYKKEVGSIRAEALPGLKRAYVQFVVDDLGLSNDEIKVSLKNSGQTAIRFTSLSKWSDPDFAARLVRSQYNIWANLGFERIEFYKQVSTGDVAVSVYYMRWGRFVDPRTNRPL